MTLLKELWLTGGCLAFASFGIKVGLGLAPILFSKEVEFTKKFIIFFGTFILYLALFWGLYFIIVHFKLSDYINYLFNMMRYAMLFHLLLAMGFLFWGVRLLIFSQPVNNLISLSVPAISLIIPCPVCVIVIFLNLSMSLSLLSHVPLVVMLGSFLLFWSIVVFILSITCLLKDKFSLRGQFLGTVMCLVVVYFLLTIIIAPICHQIKTVYAMACSNNVSSNLQFRDIGVFAGSVVFLVMLGFIRSYFSMGERK